MTWTTKMTKMTEIIKMTKIDTKMTWWPKASQTIDRMVISNYGIFKYEFLDAKHL